MTEDDAKTKWCPHVVASHTDPRQAPSKYEREAGVTSPFRHNCIASACMARREITALHAFDLESGEYLGVRSAIHAPTQEFRRVPAGGFCGLAGRPA